MIKPYQYYINKYLATPFSNKRYKLCFSPRYKFLWFRVAKCGSRTINKHLKELAGEDYVYTSPIGYLPGMFKDYLKIAFVRDPVARFISAWKDKVVKQNYFRFSSEIHDKMQNIDNFIDYVEGSDLAKTDVHIRPQHHLIDLNNIDFLGRSEYFETDLKTLFRDHFNKEIEDISHKNRTKSETVEISIEQRKRIIQIYELDFRIFYPGEHRQIIGE